jgi:hypothetical protein
LIIEHELGNFIFWTVYEHIAGIDVHLHDIVDTEKPIARFMNKEELNKYGWQFDHIHFEILKVKPLELKPDNRWPERRFNSYSLICYTLDELHHYFYNPLDFLNDYYR